MNNILKLMPLKTLIRLVLQIMQYIVSKTKNTKDDEVVQGIVDIYLMILPFVQEKKKR